MSNPRLPPAPPEKYHRVNHRGDFATCWDCQRARAICRSKLRFDTWEAADDSARRFNQLTEYRRALVRYRCRWCLLWHMKTARSAVDRARAEKQRRKWLVRQRREAPPAVADAAGAAEADRDDMGYQEGP